METPLAEVLIHADWSVAPKKRWAASATWARRWTIDAVSPVGPMDRFVLNLIKLGASHRVIAGFDFPIGVPTPYGAKTGLPGFRALVGLIGTGRWSAFAEVARRPDEISIERPFFPAGAAAGLKQVSLLNAHGASSLDDLRRLCERATTSRRAACPLFWTLGGNQVGRAALAGWREVIQPALAGGARLWPFDGDLADLTSRNGTVLAETYPAEAYAHVGVVFANNESKTRQLDRRGKAETILNWAIRSEVALAEPVLNMVRDGFGSDRNGEDQFDAFMGLLGMIEVADRRRDSGVFEEGNLKSWEGWILGQALPTTSGATS